MCNIRQIFTLSGTYLTEQLQLQIDIDFNTLYPNRTSSISDKWSDFTVRFMTKCSKDIKDPPSKALLNDIATNKDIAEGIFFK